MAMEHVDKGLSRTFWTCGKLVVLPWLVAFAFLWAKKVSLMGWGWADLFDLPVAFVAGWWLLSAAGTVAVGAIVGLDD